MTSQLSDSCWAPATMRAATRSPGSHWRDEERANSLSASLKYKPAEDMGDAGLPYRDASQGAPALADTDREDWKREVPQGFNCGCMFPWLLIEALVHLSIYIYKLFEDSRTVAEYWHSRQVYGLAVTGMCLVAPTFIYSLYEVLRTVIAAACGDATGSCRELLTRLVKGVLLIPWQIKGHCEMLAFSADKACLCRRLERAELQELSRIKQDTFVLEFFEDFYSGFIQLVMQLHFIVSFSSKPMAGSKIIYTEVLGSSLAVLSLIKALQRRDDGCLTKTLSFFGWACYCAARALALALFGAVLGPLVGVVMLLHATVVTVIVFRIVKCVHREQRLHRLAAEEAGGRRRRFGRRTSDGVLAVLSFFLFGLPSLMYWPMMFAFKRRVYVLTFLAVGAVENLLFFIVWFFLRDAKLLTESSDPLKDTADLHRIGRYFAIAVVTLTIVGCCCITLYTYAKPSLTDQVVLSHIRETNSNKYGIFFDFCKAVNVLPAVDLIDHRRDQLRQRPDLLPPGPAAVEAPAEGRPGC